MSLVPCKEAWQLLGATQDGGLQLVLPGWPPGCCFPTVVVVGGHEWAAGGRGCHAFACGLGEASAATPRRPGRTVTGGGDRGARPRSPSAQETAGGRSTDKVYHIIV